MADTPEVAGKVLPAVLCLGMDALNVPAPNHPEGDPLNLHSSAPDFRKRRWLLAAILLLVIIALLTGSLAYYRREQEDVFQSVKKELGTIADLKINRLVSWRHEREVDANFFFRSAFMSGSFCDYLSNPGNRVLAEQIAAQLAWLVESDSYDQILFLDPELRVRLALPTSASPLQEKDRDLAAAALRAGRVLFSDLHRAEEGGNVHLNMAVPLPPSTLPAPQPRSGQSAPSAPVGILLFQLSAEKFLFPLIQSWPTSSPSAETLLVRREGDEVVFLNELRHRKGTALTLRFPISRADLPAAMAIHEKEGVVQGLDYRGMPVVAAIRAVPGTPWHMVAKVDEDEIYAPLRREAWTTGIVVAALLTAAMLGIGFLWYQRDSQWLRQEVDIQRDRLALAERIRHVNNHAYDMILLADENWRILEANDSALHAYGYAFDEFLQLTMLDLRAPGWRADLHSMTELVKAGGRATIETVHQRKDGSTFPVEVGICHLKIEGRGFYQSIARDISERKRAEEELRASEEHNRNLFENMPNGLAVYRTIFEQGRPHDFVYVSVNSAFESLTGLKNVVGRRVSDVIPGIRESDPGLLEIYGRVALTGVPERVETYVEALKMWFAISVFSSKPEHFVVVFDVITDRKRAEEELRRHRDHLEELVGARAAELRDSEAKYLGLYDSLKDGVAQVDMEGRLVECNSGFCEMLGYSREELGLLTYVDLTPARWRDFEAEIVTSQILPRGYSDEYEKEYIRKDGRIIPISIRSWLIKDPDGKPAGMWELVRDITERKEAATRVQELNEGLRLTIARLEDANREMEAFSYSVSHDLRAPLRAIHGFAGILAEEHAANLDDEGRRVLDVIYSQSDRMGVLIDDLLSFSRMSRQFMKMEPINMTALAEDEYRAQAGLCPGRRLEFTILPLPPARGDRAMMRVVWGNLISNAVKFTRHKDPAVIEIGAARTASAGQDYYYIKDNGAGFNMKYAHKLFGVFQRLHNSTEFEGTGVGLALAQRIVHRHGGRIWAEGKINAGAKFYFQIAEEADNP